MAIKECKTVVFEFNYYIFRPIEHSVNTCLSDMIEAECNLKMITNNILQNRAMYFKSMSDLPELLTMSISLFS